MAYVPNLARISKTKLLKTRKLITTIFRTSYTYFTFLISPGRRSEWPRCLRHRSAAGRLLRL